MPVIPRGLSDRMFNRIRQRVQDSLGAPSVQPVAPTRESVDTGLSSRIRQFVQDRLGLEPSPTETVSQTQAPVVSGPPTSLEEIKQRIQDAARRMPPLKLRALYNGAWRNLSPYSFRYRDADDPHIPLLYAYCDKDKQVECFKLKKFQDLQITAEPYVPQYPVEF